MSFNADGVYVGHTREDDEYTSDHHTERSGCVYCGSPNHDDCGGGPSAFYFGGSNEYDDD